MLQMKRKIEKDYYAQLNKWITAWEEFKPCRKDHSTDAICDRITWCWKFRKITEEQMHELCDRMVNLFQTISKYKMYD